MTQRNPMNERYQSEERTGKTRKSASAAKPVTKAAATTSDPAPKTKKQKKAEARERERKEMEKAHELGIDSGNMPTVQYHNLRRQYWVSLIGAIVCTVLSFITSGMDEPFSNYSIGLLIMAYVLIILALYIDMGKIRKLRKSQQQVMQGKSKAARREQKARAAEAREQQKEAAAAYAAAKEQEANKAAEKKTVGQRVKGWFGLDKAKKAKTDLQEKAEAVKTAEAKKEAAAQKEAKAEKTDVAAE